MVSWFFAAELYEQGHLTDEEYSRRKNEIIDAMMVCGWCGREGVG